MTKIETNINRVKNSEVVVYNDNRTIEAGTLIPQKILKSNLDDIPRISDDLNNSLSITNVLLSSKLPKELQNYFEIKNEIINNRVEFVTRPKTKDAYEKFPIKISYRFDVKGKTEEEIERMRNIPELSKQANLTGKPVKIGNILSATEYLGKYVNPTSIINSKDIVKSELYIMPDPLPPGKKFRFEMFNESIKFEIQNLNLRLKKRDENKVVLSNYESKNDYFDFYLIATLNNVQKTRNINFKITITCKEEWMNSCEKRLELYKFAILMNDKNTTLIMTDLEDNKEFYKTSNVGKEKYTKKKLNAISREIKVIEKLLYIEKIKGIKFEYNLEKIRITSQLIDLVYCECINKSITIKKPTYWTIPINKEAYINFEKNHNKIFYFETYIDNLEILGINIKLKDNLCYMYNCRIIKMEKKNKKYMLHYSSEKLKITFGVNCTKE